MAEAAGEGKESPLRVAFDRRIKLEFHWRVLEGSVRKAGERVRITGQLIDALSGAHIWAERFEGTLADVFELQDRVAEGVAGAIEPTLRGAEIERARRKPTGSLDAYDLYLRALPHVFTPTAEDNREALRLLEEALALDPGYAAALGLKAWCHLRAYLHGWAGDDEGERTSGEHAARRALAAGRDDPTALAMGGFVVSLLAHDHEAGLAALGRAVTLKNSALALFQRHGALLRRGLRDGGRARPAGAAAQPVRPAELQATDRAGTAASSRRTCPPTACRSTTR